MRNRFDDIWEAINAHEEVEAAREYLQGGRAFASMTVAALTQAWVEAFTAVALGSDARIEEALDLDAELSLRRRGRPGHLVPEAVMDAFDRRRAGTSPDEIEFGAQRARRLWQLLKKEAARPN